ncbi:Cytochrome c-554 precursor [Posidoniimonas polymericola]|uniref:Cytochrome c-554 n=1 Tax=Posidoniimonas polymericola TaxID=2528002 RepID=A0A5C5YRA2_9BACT|nr:multiheme c-type cytochrome [Posidoniimonas polymericola]TWT77474.1 Cytochrome c-554 precursor [Posidoniimonas polymericola]
MPEICRSYSSARVRGLMLLSMLALSCFVIGVFVDASSGDEATEAVYSEKPSLPDKHAKVDPIEANGRIFADWPKPDATLVFTGAQDGYLEPCGCAGLTNQKGGLKRRYTFLTGLEAEGWNPIAMDTGGQVKRFGQQSQIKLRRGLEALVAMDYQGVAFGVKDLQMDLLGVLINFDSENNPMTSANVGVFGFDDSFSQRYRVVEKGGLKIGFTSVLGKKQIAKLGQLSDIDLVDPEEALQEVVPKLQAEGCDQLVLLVHDYPAEATELAKKFPVFDWVVAGLGSDVPAINARKIEGTSGHLLEVGHKGMYAVAIGLYSDGAKPFRYQSVPIDHRFEDAQEMQDMLVAYQNELKTMTLKGLGVRAVAHPTGHEFAGSAVCGDCHTAAMEVFESTPHSHATKTLVDLDPPRHFDPECLSCHVTGWSPQQYVPFNSGYASLQTTPHLTDNGCENCHGPAAKHVAAENGDIDANDAEIEALRQELHMELVENEGNKDGQNLGPVVNNCLLCHDEDNSPEFDFQRYWPHVEHHGKD